ncbi:MAG: hypothetical protein QNJ84_08085 [Alphaproteobacteria bacterium]|nr:hypothetical protein [Alphaproteobacteria bacterium]
MIKAIHPIAGGIAFACVAAFFGGTVATKLSGSPEAITAVKLAIPWGFFILIPAMAAAGGTGFVQSRDRDDQRIGAKRRRMPFIVANGCLVLIPAALFLANRAAHQDFGPMFQAVQTVELIAGALNLVLLGLNIRDGFISAGRIKDKTLTLRRVP